MSYPRHCETCGCNGCICGIIQSEFGAVQWGIIHTSLYTDIKNSVDHVQTPAKRPRKEEDIKKPMHKKRRTIHDSSCTAVNMCQPCLNKYLCKKKVKSICKPNLFFNPDFRPEGFQGKSMYETVKYEVNIGSRHTKDFIKRECERASYLSTLPQLPFKVNESIKVVGNRPPAFINPNELQDIYEG